MTFLGKLVRTYILAIYKNLSESCKTINCVTVNLLLLLHKSCINWKSICFACCNWIPFFSIAFLHTVLLKCWMEVPTLSSAAEQTNIWQPHSVQASSHCILLTQPGAGSLERSSAFCDHSLQAISFDINFSFAIMIALSSFLLWVFRLTAQNNSKFS